MSARPATSRRSRSARYLARTASGSNGTDTESALCDALGEGHRSHELHDMVIDADEDQIFDRHSREPRFDRSQEVTALLE